MSSSIFITGGTGYIGSRLIPLLAERGHKIKALVRDGSESKLPAGANGVVEGNVEPKKILVRLNLNRRWNATLDHDTDNNRNSTATWTCQKLCRGPCPVSRPCEARTLGPGILARTGKG